MKERSMTIVTKIIEGGILLLTFLLPLFFLPQASGIFEFPKTLLLTLSVSVLGVFWIIEMILKKSVKILHGPLTIPVLVFSGTFILSVIFSVHRFSSFYGSYPRFHDGIVSVFVFVFLFFLISSNMKEKKQIMGIVAALCFSSVIVALWGILNFFETYLPGNSLRNSFLTPAGSGDQTTFFLATVFPFFYFSFLFSQKKPVQVLAALAGFVLLVYIFLVFHIAAILALALTLLTGIIFVARLQSPKGTWMKTFISIALIAILAISQVKSVKTIIPFLGGKSPQHEITLDANTAWAITVSPFQNLKLLTVGSGPGTFIYDFTSFKPLEFNQTSFWNLRFEKSFNEYFQIISTVGMLGFLAFLWVLLRFLKMGRRLLKKAHSGKNEEKYVILGTCTSLAVIIFLFIFTPSFTLISFIFWLLLGAAGALAGLCSVNGVKDIELSIAAIHAKGRDIRAELLPSVLLAIILAVVIPLLWQETALLRGEIQFTKAQRMQSPDADTILESYTRARNLVPRNDAYRRTLSATALNIAILGNQQNTLPDQTKQDLLKFAISEGETAVGLAPHNIFNWENLQNIYSSVTVQNQDALLINKVYPQEILLDPVNPKHRNDLGWAYFNFRNDVELAKRNIQDAISLKSDFADAHYNLARVYGKEDEKEKALQEYTQTLALLDRQISQLERIVAARPDAEELVNQSKQFAAQIQKEKEKLEFMIEKEKAPLAK